MGPHEPLTHAEQTPRPEDAGLRVIDAYSRRYNVTVSGFKGAWEVTGADLEEPVRMERYTDLIGWLARTFEGI